MKQVIRHSWLILGVAALLFAGCSKPYTVLISLDAPLNEVNRVSVGSIVDNLPASMEAKDKPTLEDIQKFKGYLNEELDKSKFFNTAVPGMAGAEYEVRGQLTKYKKGSGFLRFLFGSLAGAYVTCELDLVERNSGRVVFTGEFKGSVTSEFEKGTEMFKKVAKDFTKVVEKEHKKLAEAQVLN